MYISKLSIFNDTFLWLKRMNRLYKYKSNKRADGVSMDIRTTI